MPPTGRSRLQRLQSRGLLETVLNTPTHRIDGDGGRCGDNPGASIRWRTLNQGMDEGATRNFPESVRRK